jgi:general stress protein YciG
MGGWVISRDRKHVSRIGRKGGIASGRKKQREEDRAEKKTAGKQ